MYNPRIALVAEGPTDLIIIEAVLKAILRRPFILTRLPDEKTLPSLGTGWCGVLKWCLAFRQRGAISLEADPTLQGFDLVIVHLDADVAHKSYADCNYSALAEQCALPPLPCNQPCPPATGTAQALAQVLSGWLGITATGRKSLFWIPSKASEAWLTAALMPADHPLLNALECNLSLETQLAQQPIRSGQRIKKGGRNYQRHAPTITEQWAQVKQHCTQATAFEQQLLQISNTFPP